MSNLYSKHHSFDVAFAEEFKSIDLAVLLHHFQHWISHNKALNRNQHEGRTWTYQTLQEIAATFPYWSRKQVERLIEKAVHLKVLRKGNFNKSKFDRTAWYAFENEEKFGISRNREMDDPQSGNQSPEIGTPIPDIIPYKEKEKDKKKKKETPILPSAKELSQFFYDKLKEINPMIHFDPKKWEQEMNTVLTKPGRTEESIKQVIEYIIFQHHNSTNDFRWSDSISSPKTLDKKFAILWIQMTNRNGKKPTQELSVESDKEFAEKIWVELKNRSDVHLGNSYIEFVNGPKSSWLGFGTANFKQNCLQEINKRNLKLNL